MVLAFGKAIRELVFRKQWRRPLPWLALALCLIWPIVIKFSPCFVLDPITREINAMGDQKCYQRL
jgi:hypothetical protein